MTGALRYHAVVPVARINVLLPPEKCRSTAWAAATRARTGPKEVLGKHVTLRSAVEAHSGTGRFDAAASTSRHRIASARPWYWKEFLCAHLLSVFNNEVRLHLHREEPTNIFHGQRLLLHHVAHAWATSAHLEFALGQTPGTFMLCDTGCRRQEADSGRRIHEMLLCLLMRLL